MKRNKKIYKKCIICDKSFYTYKIKQMCCCYSCARINTWKNQEYRNKKIENLKNSWTDEKKKQQSEFQKKYQNLPDVKLKMSSIQKIAQNKKGVNEKRSKKFKKLWNNLDYAEKILNNGLRYKEFILPSGKIIKLQGYEDKVLLDLLKIYDENDIVIGVKNINTEIGKIIYNFNNKKCRYFPDFFIKSINTIIEVKSEWTYLKQKERNECKRIACLDKGFNFKFIIK